jgi:hypothetical protein
MSLDYPEMTIRGQEAEGKSLLEPNFGDLGCPNQLVLCYIPHIGMNRNRLREPKNRELNTPHE